MMIWITPIRVAIPIMGLRRFRCQSNDRQTDGPTDRHSSRHSSRNSQEMSARRIRQSAPLKITHETTPYIKNANQKKVVLKLESALKLATNKANFCEAI